MRKFIVCFSFFSCPIVVVLVAVNYFGDVANLFRPSFEKNIAKTLLLKNNVTGITNFDDRILQKEIILNDTLRRRCIIFGSSRSRQIKGFNLNVESFFNHSLNGATLEDFIALTQLYRVRGTFPDRLIINLDPWILNEFHTQTRWTSLKSEVNEFRSIEMNEIVEKEINFHSNYFQLISPSYFQGSLKKLITGTEKFEATKNMYNSKMTFLTDGSITYGDKIRNASKIAVDALVNESLKGKLYSVENFSSLSKTYQDWFLSLILFWKSKGVSIDFILLPYHPKIYNLINSNKAYRSILESEQYFKKVGEMNKICTYGVYDPKYFNISEDDFMDGIHLNERGLEKVISRLYSPVLVKN